MPSIPPPGGIEGVAFFSGFSATIASVVTSRPVTEAVFCSARRTTFCRVDDAGLDHVDVFAGLRVITPVEVVPVEQFADHDRPFGAGVLGDLPDRRLQCALDDVDPDLLVVVFRRQPVERLGGIEQSHTAAGDDAFFDRGSRRVGGVVDAVLVLLDLDLGGAADPDHRDAAGAVDDRRILLLDAVLRADFAVRREVLRNSGYWINWGPDLLR